MDVSRTAFQRFLGIAAATAVILGITLPLATQVASASIVSTFDQCANGKVSAPVSCNGNYQHGDLNPQNAHFREGDFVPYRIALNSLAAGTNVFDFHWRPGDSGEHAIDYIGSYDATETTGPPSSLYANGNNPCSDITMGAGWCTPSSPAAEAAVPAADFTDATNANCGTNGTFVGTQSPGDIKIFGPSGTAITGLSYTEQNVSDSGGCDSGLSVTFTLPSALPSGDSIVIAWGGHIASTADWGAGNAAGDISGSPYHMILDSITTGGATTGLGSTERSMKTTTIFFTPTVTTQIETVPGGTPMTTVLGGTTVQDTATITGASGGEAGTVTYVLFNDGTCTAGTNNVDVRSTQTVTVANGVVPASSDFTTPIGGGSFSYQATYNGDGGSNNPSLPGACEPLTVNPSQPSVSTTIVLAGTATPVSGPVTAGTSVQDTTTLTGGTSPTGTVTYTFFTDPSGETGCNGTTQVFSNVALGTASPAVGPLADGNYGFEAHYNGDVGNVPADGTCEPLTVATPIFTVLKTDVPGNGKAVAPGSTIPYTVTIQNVGDGAGSATITDVLPSSLTMQGSPACTVTTPPGDTCVPSFDTSTNTLTVPVTLGVGDKATVTFSAVLAKTDTADVVNTATITQGDCTPNPPVFGIAFAKSHAATIQCSSTVTNPVSDFTVTKTDVPGNGQSVTAGSTIPYTVVIKNVGDGAGAAVITDTLPSDLTIKGTSACAVTSPDTCTVTNTTGSTWTFAVNLAAGNSATVTFSATVAATTTGTVTNTATITTGPCNTSSGCSSTVSNPIPPVVAPAVATPTTTTPAPAAPAPAIAFTGADLEGMWAAATALLGLGGLMAVLARRRKRHAS